MVQDLNRFFYIFSSKREGNFLKKDFRNKDSHFSKFIFQFKINIKDCVLMEQVHGDRVAVVGKKDGSKIISQVDGLITKEKEIFLACLTADCQPVLFWDREAKIVGIAHLGWRGTYIGLAGKMIEKMVELGARLDKIEMKVGPSIKKCCYEVDEKRAFLFQERFGKRLVEERKGKFYLDLQSALEKQFLDLGIKKEKMSFSEVCTCCDGNYWSYREEGRRIKGQNLSLVGIFNEKRK